MQATPNSEMDALRDAIRQGERLRDRLNAPLQARAPVAAPAQSDWLVPSPKQLGRAVLGWHVGVFGLCYMLLPALMDSVGMDLNIGLLPSAFSVGAVALALFAGVRLFKPEVRVPRDLRRAPRDPVIAATAGSFLSWLVMHNTLPLLEHLPQMPLITALGFTAVNVVESALFGTMLASFTRRTLAAAALGVAHQLSILGIYLVLYLMYWYL